MTEIATWGHDNKVLNGLHSEGYDEPLSNKEVKAIYNTALQINEKAVGNVFTAFNQQQAKEQIRSDEDLQEELWNRDRAAKRLPGTYFTTSTGREPTLGTALDNPKSIRASSGFNLPDGNDLFSINALTSAQPLGSNDSFLTRSGDKGSEEDSKRKVTPTPTSRLVLIPWKGPLTLGTAPVDSFLRRPSDRRCRTHKRWIKLCIY